MNTDIQPLVREAVRAVSAIVVSAIVMLGLLAIVRDGEVASAIASSLENAITWGLPVIGAIVVALQIMSGYVQGRGEQSPPPPPPPPRREGGGTPP